MSPLVPGEPGLPNRHCTQERLTGLCHLGDVSPPNVDILAISEPVEEPPYESFALNSALKSFINHLNLQGNNMLIYYPGSDKHIVPVTGFAAGTKVIYVDPNEASMRQLRDQQLLAHANTAQTFDLQNNNYGLADLTIYLNPNGFSHKDIENQIRPGGYLITSNGWNKTASHIATDKDSGFTLRYIIPANQESGELEIIDAQNSTITWKPNQLGGTNAEIEGWDTNYLNNDDCYYVFSYNPK